MIKPQELARLKARVHTRIEQLTAKAEPGEGHVSPGQQSDDVDATLDITINAIIGEQVRDGAQQELRVLVRQLEWLDSDDAGYCAECGQPIPLARLEAVPATRLCIGCAEQGGRKRGA